MMQLKEMIADAADNDRRLTESELFTQQMQKVTPIKAQSHVQSFDLQGRRYIRFSRQCLS